MEDNTDSERISEKVQLIQLNRLLMHLERELEGDVDDLKESTDVTHGEHVMKSAEEHKEAVKERARNLGIHLESDDVKQQIKEVEKKASEFDWIEEKDLEQIKQG